MKAIFLAIAFGLVPAAGAQAVELRPLSEVIAQESSPTNTIYIATRCAGYFAAMSTRLTASGRGDVESIVEKTNAGMVRFMLTAVQVAEDHDLNQDAKYIMDQTTQIAALYDAEMSANYLAEGNAIGVRTAADATICGQMLGAP